MFKIYKINSTLAELKMLNKHGKIIPIKLEVNKCICVLFLDKI